MAWLTKLMWNADEGRIRALWRLFVHTIALGVGWYPISVVVVSLGVTSGEGGLGLDSILTAALAVAGATWLVATKVDGRPFAALGLKLDRQWWVDALAGVGIGLVLMAAIFAFELALGWVRIEGYALGAGEGRGFGLMLLEPFVVFIAVAFYEELISRGYHLRNLAEGLAELGPGPISAPVALLLATLASSAVFGLLHASNANATWISTFNVGLAGVMLAASVLWTGQLGLAMGLHLSWNFCQGNLFGFPVSGNDAGPRVIGLEQLGDPLVTGGAFGPEAGLIGIAAMLVGLGLQAAWVRVTRGQVQLEQDFARYSAGES